MTFSPAMTAQLSDSMQKKQKAKCISALSGMKPVII
jgi:hypothetical protein